MSLGLLDVTLRLSEVLDAEAQPYAFVGGIAAIVWGVGRTTLDADVLILTADAERVLRALTARGFTQRATSRDVNDEIVTVGARLELDERARADLIVTNNLAAGDLLVNRVKKSFLGQTLWVLACEDLIVMKLQAGRARDVEDARLLLETHKDTLDWPRLRAQADLFSLTDVLAQLVPE